MRAARRRLRMEQLSADRVAELSRPVNSARASIREASSSAQVRACIACRPECPPNRSRPLGALAKASDPCATRRVGSQCVRRGGRGLEAERRACLPVPSRRPALGAMALSMRRSPDLASPAPVRIAVSVRFGGRRHWPCDASLIDAACEDGRRAATASSHGSNPPAALRRPMAPAWTVAALRGRPLMLPQRNERRRIIEPRALDASTPAQIKKSSPRARRRSPKNLVSKLAT